MIHEAFASRASGDADAMRVLADRLDANTAAIADIYVARTGNDINQVRSWMKAETWFYGEGAVSAGFADSVVANQRIAARFNPDHHAFRNAPADIGERPNTAAFRQRLAQMQATMTRSRV